MRYNPPQAVWAPAFPTGRALRRAARGIPVGESSWSITVSPGALTVARRAGPSKTSTEQRTGRVIIGWSRKSRSNMCRVLCEIDYSPLLGDVTRIPAMITLTYPGDWITVAPSGRAVKRHLDALVKRYERRYGHRLVAVWKLEFQRRGAPHLHILMVPPVDPQFRAWLSTAWMEIVDHPDPAERAKHELAGTGVDYAEGLRARDPKRVAVYFCKHGSLAAKEYQNVVPDAWREPDCGPGRFWGYRGLRRLTVTTEVSDKAGLAAGRVLRRWSRAQGQRRVTVRPRVEKATGRIRYRNTSTRVTRMHRNRGWVSVNDGAAFASQIARYLNGPP